jgi:hypothetical protein
MRRVRHTRICHYPLTLKELTKYLPAEADPGKWKETILRLESTATAINLSKAEAKDIEKLFDIEKKLDGLEVRQQSRVLWVNQLMVCGRPPPQISLAKCYTTQTQIALAGRKLVLEGPLKIKKKQVKDGHVYLFKYGLGLASTRLLKLSLPLTVHMWCMAVTRWCSPRQLAPRPLSRASPRSTSALSAFSKTLTVRPPPFF